MLAVARSCIALVATALAASIVLNACGPSGKAVLGAPVHTDEFFSRTFRVRDLYPSMVGPAKTRPLDVNAEPAELIWVTGVRMEVVDMDGDRMDKQDNLCHANIRSRHMGGQWERHNAELFGGMRHLPAKWFTLVAGQLDLEFPSGFGIPMYSDEPLEAFTMILNQDPDFEPFDFRVKTQLDYVYDRELTRPMRALSRTGFDTKVLVEEVEGEEHDHAAHAESCGLGDDDVVLSHAEPAGPNPVIYPGEHEKTMHFMVPPGRHEFRDRHPLAGLPEGLPFVNAHYVTAHLHVYGESIELIDVTEGISIFKSRATPNADMTAVVEMESWSSERGVSLFPDHEYEVVTTYNNTTDREVDAMGVFYIYFENPYFQAERLAEWWEEQRRAAGS